MINSVNALEFLKPKLITMDKYNSTTTTKLLPPTSLAAARTFVTISGHHAHPSATTIDSHQEKQQQKQQQQSLFNHEFKQQERVKVQHLENHTKLQNNKCWNNFRTLYTSTSSLDVKNDNDRELLDKISQTVKDDNEIDVVNVEHLSSKAATTITPINIQNKSAFTLDLNKKNYHNNNNNNNSICGNNNYNYIKMDASLKGKETNNNFQVFCKQYNNNYISPTTPTTTAMIGMSLAVPQQPQPSTIIPTSTTQRTEDQNMAYRHIESVHNYAKSKSYEDDEDNQSPNGSRHSSYLDDEDEEDDDDEEDEDDNGIEAVYDNDEDDIDYEERLDGDYEDIFNRRHKRLQKLSTSSDGALTIRSNKLSNRGVIFEQSKPQFLAITKDRKIHSVKVNNKQNEDEEVHVDVDVETIETQLSPSLPGDMKSTNSMGNELSAINKPDHHARRPMNAFLIFCKRHRAIVKERYKNLENRAITKILGDWWAFLDTNDKKCFTNLAQQNKDAFFSANPNFKWYKLPAPPLRTLTTRPANAFGQEYPDDNEAATNSSNSPETISNNIRMNNNHSNYFKLADEAQMGDLSHLMQDKSKDTKQTADLQQALGETSQFMSAHITGNAEVLEENPLKRRFISENSFSSNSSEEDSLEPKKKSARSCKGKRYQELINSGQIATSVKKTKPSARTGAIMGDHIDLNIKQNLSNVNNLPNNLLGNSNICQKRSVSECCDNMLPYEFNSFDLEERIKELPALNLDDYLQRKRNTKKKKKFSTNGKKRGPRNEKSSKQLQNSVKAGYESFKQISGKLLQHIPATATAVGSQKRKARKESITRRDVSAIEQEVASLLPLTINGCCYFQEAPYLKKEKDEVAISPKYIENNECHKTFERNCIKVDKDTELITPQTLNFTSTSPIIPLQHQTSSTLSSTSVSVDIFNDDKNITNNSNTLNDNISSSTSDLLILAEVAANRTELKH